jgi:glycosyltransferase involved in cell wall biosynthesis
VPRYALAKELKSSWAWFYPTTWPETYCIAGLEAQAAGTPIVAPPYAALNETVKGGILTHDFLNGFSQLRNKRRWEKLSLAGIEFAKENTWMHRADEWVELANG